MRYRPVFIEDSPKAYNNLCGILTHELESLSGCVDFKVIREDNEKYLKEKLVADVALFDRPWHAQGSILIDPNGFGRKNGMVMMDTLREVAVSLPNFMLLIFSPCSMIPRVAGYKFGKPKGTGTKQDSQAQRDKASLLKVDDFLPLRPYWLIGISKSCHCLYRIPCDHQAQHVYLCGTSRFYKGYGIALELTSERGYEFYRRAHGEESRVEINKRSYWYGSSSISRDFSAHDQRRVAPTSPKY